LTKKLSKKKQYMANHSAAAAKITAIKKMSLREYVGAERFKHELTSMPTS